MGARRPRHRWCVAVAMLAMVLSGCTTVAGHPMSAATPTTAATSAPATTSGPGAIGTAGTPSASGTSGSSPLDLPTLPGLRPPDEEPATRTEELEQALSTGSGPTLQQAIDVFSVSFATLSGASSSTLPDGDGFSGTVARAYLAPYLSQLTPEQRDIVDSFDGTVIAATEPGGHQLAPVGTGDTTGTSSTTTTETTSAPTATQTTSGAPTATTPTTTATQTTSGAPTATTPTTTAATVTAPGLRGAGAARDGGDHAPTAPSPGPNAHEIDLFQQTLDDWIAYRPDLMNRPQGFHLAVSTKQPKDGAEMDTHVDPRTHLCVVTMYPIVTNGLAAGSYTDATVKYIFAHELFHCVQFTWSSLSYSPEWLVEGSAEFAALDLYRTTFQPIPTEAYQGWFTDPGRPLGKEPKGRGYDDWPLFEAFKQQYTTDPYPAIQAMLSAGGLTTKALLDAGHIDNEVFDTLWTSTSLRSTSYPESAFQLRWPGVQPDYGTRDTALNLGTGAIGEYPVAGKGGFAHQNFTVGFRSDVGVVSVVPSDGPLLTRADTGPVAVGEGDQAWFCVKSGGCTCPDGMVAPASLTPLTPPMLFSFAAQTDIPSADVTAMPWDPDKYCGAPKPAGDGTGDGGGSVSGSSNGDPHVTTYNGLHYDFMTYGEFVTSSDPSGGFTVQERHAQAGFGTAISAVAVGDGTHRITFTTQQISSDAPITVKVDGTDTTNDTLTAGGLSLTRDQTGGEPEWTIAWPDGSAVDVRWGTGFFVTVAPAPARRAHLVGLLGTPGPTFLHDLSLPDGSRADPTDGYADFVAAYRVTANTTLFDYEPGQSPDTFAHAPATQSPVLPPTTDAVSGCRTGLGDEATPTEIDDCAYDATSLGAGNPAVLDAFTSAYAAVTEQRTEQIVDSPEKTPPAPIVVGSTGPTSPIAPESDTTGPPAPSSVAAAPSAQAGDTPWLTLSGTVADPAMGSLPGPEQDLTGSIRLPKDTVLVIKADRCPPSTYLFVNVALHDGSFNPPAVRPFVCDQNYRPPDDPNDTTADNEIDVMITTAGVYDITVSTDAAAAFQTSVALYADPTPTLVSTEDFMTKGFTGTLSGIGDTVLATVKADAGMGWTLSGGGTICRAFSYAFVETDPGPTDIGRDCWHNPDPAVSIGPTAGTVYLIYSRDPGSQQISLVPRS